MPINTFELVQEPPSDAATFILRKDGDRQCGQIFCPAPALGGRIPKDFRGAEMPLKEAFRAAIKFANDFKVPLVVQDPDGLWQAEWGTLYREEDEDSPAPSQ